MNVVKVLENDDDGNDNDSRCEEQLWHRRWNLPQQHSVVAAHRFISVVPEKSGPIWSAHPSFNDVMSRKGIGVRCFRTY
ncbi:hypothetical protein PoB_006900400 [Plakobranchus ocellatus]|uniref:Uncharacterized protein n=1 Tax=Plakobranchus ocellatus TaxID=259542 RepID=A0AAV4DE62_9GAST|nr:hypothetical protein PoB_006900400 [Plakobranchus ocellatus]